MPVLPLVDLLILVASFLLLAGSVVKAVYITTVMRPTLFGLTPSDLVFMAVVCFIFALALAARTWLKLNEPRLASLQRLASRMEAERQERSVGGSVAGETSLAASIAGDRRRAEGRS